MASSFRLAQESKPDELELLEQQIATLQIELDSLKNESNVFAVERRTKVENDLKAKREEADEARKSRKAQFEEVKESVTWISQQYYRAMQRQRRRRKSRGPTQ